MGDEMVSSLKIIRGEHRNLAALLTCFRGLLRDAERDGRLPDFTLLESILRYLREFLNCFHHPKESQHLFPALRRRYGAAADLISTLEGDHAKVGPMLAALEERLAACRRGGLAQLPALREAVEAYCRLELTHMGREESEILSLAQAHLTDEDWREIDAAFAVNDDPLFGSRRRQSFSRLYSWIVARAPAPHGLGQHARLDS